MDRALPISPDLAGRLGGTPLAILLDIDGTLAPIAPRPEAARVPAETLAVVLALTRLAEVHVAVVTGRSVADARRLVPVDGVGIIGNHGFEFLGESGDLIVIPEARRFHDALRSAAAQVDALARRHQGLVAEDKMWTLSLHFRLAERNILPEVVESVASIASSLGLIVTRGKEVLEMRPPIEVNKGTAAVQWASRLHALGADASSIYVGDDRTDEDAFRLLRAAAPTSVAVRVGQPEDGELTSAEFFVETPEDVREFLGALLDLRQERQRSD